LTAGVDVTSWWEGGSDGCCEELADLLVDAFAEADAFVDWDFVRGIFDSPE
jgi:hypothetical protein